MKFDFTPVHNALGRCRRVGLEVPIWWRDDDATATTPELEQLLALADITDCTVHIAAIPAIAKVSLFDSLSGSKSRILVHGWAHANRSPAGEKKAEFGHTRPDAVGEMANALTRLRRLTNDNLIPTFVPPWNRLPSALIGKLPALGYTGVSMFGARSIMEPAPGLVMTNTHIDPIFWKGTRDLAEPTALISHTALELERRLEGQSDPTEPLGLLTHHLVHTDGVWAFAKAWLSEMQEGGAVTWQMPKE